IGTSLARERGVSAAALLDLPHYETSPLYTPLERRVLDYVVAMTSTPMVMRRELVDGLRAELGVPALVELTAAISWENQRARFNHAFGAKEEGFSDQSVCLLPREPASPPLAAAPPPLRGAATPPLRGAATPGSMPAALASKAAN